MATMTTSGAHLMTRPAPAPCAATLRAWATAAWVVPASYALCAALRVVRAMRWVAR